ncbi:hypothetical protein BO71DRAFT_480153, partial [Aspergillus ellipticus CBS 707.79]
MEPLTTAPETNTFVPLAEHQSRTPSSFHSGPAVLHYHQQNCTLVVSERDLLSIPALNALRDASTTTAATAAPTNGHTDDDIPDKEIVIPGVSVWVTSDKFLLHNPTPTPPSGLSIPYPTISLHAIQRLRLPTSTTEVQGLYMQLASPTPTNAMTDDEEECLTLTLVPPPSTPTSTTTTTTTTTTENLSPEEQAQDQQTPTQALYAAVSACSNLHPDPVEPGDEDEDDEDEGTGLFQSGVVALGDGGLPPPVDGSSGWITAENMHEFFDEEGNWIAGGEEPRLSLGPGAGT